MNATPSRIRVKICGITRIEDALVAAQLGVDAVGLVFYPGSRRFIAIPTAAKIVAALPPFVTTVGLFLDADQSAVQTVIDAVALDLLQFHGDEPPDFCQSFGKPFIKAVPMRVGADVMAYAQQFSPAKALLLDSHGGGVIGGTGEQFDWNLIPQQLPKPVILAGGLNADNITQAIAQIRPFGVDISSGVESSTKGIKDHQRMADFMRKLEHSLSNHSPNRV